MDPLKMAPSYLRALADRIQGLIGQGPPKPGDGEDEDPELPPGDWEKEFDMSSVDSGAPDKKSPPPFWESHCDRYRNNSFLNPVPQVFKKRYVYDREVGNRPIFREAEEYSDIPSASMTDYVMEDLDARLTRKEFDIPFFETELPPEGDRGKAYTFFLVDVSGSMSGERAKHACALAQVAAEKVFKEDGVFVWLPYGSDRKGAFEFTEIKSLIQHMRKTNFNCGTTHIGNDLKELAFAISLKTPYKYTGGSYLVPSDCSKDRSKVFVVHDGSDTVEDVPLTIPVFAITLANRHEMLEKIAKKTRGKYLFIEHA